MESGRGPEPIRPAAYASLFGAFHLRTCDHSEIAITNRRARAMLAMLCLAEDEPIERDVLSKRLWPGRFEAHAKASLRQCLLELGKLLALQGMDILDVSRNSVALRPGAILTDLAALEGALARGDLADATERLQAIGAKPILDGMEFGDAFNQWLARHRSDLENRLRLAVENGLAALDHERAGDTHAKLSAAWSAREMRARPSEIAAPQDFNVRIAVMPFKALNAADGQDYFADGMVDELITTLGQAPQLRVAGRTSTFHFRDSDLSIPEIAKALRVAHLIEGSVQRQGNMVRIFVRLIDGASGFENWGQRYDGSLDDIFGLQETVARAVTAALAAQLGLAMDPPQVRSPTASKEAYDLFLQGRALGVRIFGEDVLDHAIQFLERSLAIDPLLANAWVELAEAHHNVSVYTQCADRNAAALRMADCARRAIAISPQLGYPYALLATYEWTQNNVVGALDLAFEAYRREPDNPAVAMRLGSFLIYCGRTNDAAPYVQAAIDKDPADARKYALLWSVHMGRNELDAAQSVGQRIVDLGWPSMYLAAASAALGQHEAAVEQYQMTKRLVNSIILPPVGSGPMTDEAMDAYWLIAAKGVCSGQDMDRAVYFQILEMMHATLHDKADLAIVGPAIFTGNAELLFKAFGHSITPANLLALISLWSDVDPIRRIWQHPEFIPFAQRIGMAAAWDKYGWPDLLPPPKQPATDNRRR